MPQPVRPEMSDPSQPISDPASVPADASHREPPRRPHLWLWALAGGLLAGLISWGCGESTYNLFRPVFVQPPNWAKMGGYERADYRIADEVRQKSSLGLKNAALVFGVLGATLGGALGLAGGLVRRSLSGGAVAAAVGAATGAIAAAVASAGAVPVFYRFVDPEMGLITPMVTHMVIFGAIGAAGGMSLGLGLGGRTNVLKGLFGGLLGGILGALVYDVVASILFAEMRVYDPIPKEAAERLPRLLMHLDAALFVSALAVVSLQMSQVAPPSAKASELA